MTKIKYIGEQFLTNKNEEFIIIEYFGTNNVSIKFNDGTILYKKTYNAIKYGRIKNPNYPIVYNIGFIGIGKYSSNLNKKIYNTWKSMLSRCHDIKYHLLKSSYIGCTVDERWHNFQVFAEWYEQNYVDGYHLDKDILVKGNKIYGPDTCCFVPQEINSLFTKCDKSRGNLPIGVTYNRKILYTKLMKYGEQFTYGPFKTINEAFECYKSNKEAYIKYVANLRKDKIPDNVYQAMINYQVEITD